MGMKILAHTRTEHPVDLPDFRYGTLEEVLSEADVVSLHVPLFPETERLIRKETLQLMKKDAVLINTSRGGLLDEQAVADALNEGRIAAAALDVLAAEPMDPSCPLLTAKNCIITPHIAWASDDAIRKIKKVTHENVQAFLNGEELNVVN
jgi:glycerate dehydrogenase